MRERPYAFLRLGDRWVNLTMVTDIVDEGETLTIFLSSDMARMVGRGEQHAMDVARRFTLSDPGDVTKLRKWLKLNDEK
jgi:hypothetical protein